MLPKEEERKFPVKCPRCHSDQAIGDFGWLEIFDDLDRFGKTVVTCFACRKWYVIRDDGDGPFVSST